MSHDNAQILKEGLAKGLTLIHNVISESLVEAAYKLLVQAETNKEYHNMTGNTLTSYMCGIYIDGRLSKIVTMYDADMGLDKPKRGKLYRGSGSGFVYVEDYDTGKMVHVLKRNLIETDRDFGENTSRRFLMSYKAPSNKIALVMTTGTEYSELLESVKRLDVLTRTYQDAAGIISNNWKKIE